MRLLFDQNLSPRLVTRLADLFPTSTHVASEGLDCALDEEVWEHARRHDFMIVTKDADFGDLSILRGVPPKVLWLRLGNCTTQEMEALLRERHEAIVAFADDATAAVLTLLL
jgi:predicted nuclease of predicted toxin-antitoxin system